MKPNIVFSIIAIMILYGCNNSNNTINDFDKSIVISDFEVVYSEKNEFMNEIASMNVYDDNIILRNKNGDYFYSVIDTKEKRANQLIPRGRARNEYTNISRSFDITDNGLLFLDRNHKNIVSASIDTTSIKRFFRDYTTISHPYNRDFRPIGVCQIDSLYIYNGAFKKGYLGLSDCKGNIIENNSIFPIDIESFSNLMIGSCLQVNMKASSRAGKIAVVLLCSDILQIYSIKDNNLNLDFTNKYRNPPIVVNKGGRPSIDANKSIAGITNIAVSEEGVYLTYSPKSRNEWVHGNMEFDEIFHFDWNGNKVAKYILPIPMHRFCVDKEFIYGISNSVNGITINKFLKSVM